jgi:hypothetical protein
MTLSCSALGCPKDRVYAVQDSTRLYRLTFSRSLAEHIAQGRSGLQVVGRRFFLGQTLTAGTPTEAKLFAICSKKTGVCLRISLFRELAHLLTDDSRYVAEAWLIGS